MTSERGFNPRPPILAGDAICSASASSCRHVSIHARQYWRAMRPPSDRSNLRWWFQSTPANTGGRCLDDFAKTRNYDGFNPRPPILAGDARCRWWAHPALACFNPRPPILAGDACAATIADTASAVSIHARQYWRAMRVCQIVCGLTLQFQSTPANTGGRCGAFCGCGQWA